MKKTILLLSSALMIASTYAQTTVFSEDFENATVQFTNSSASGGSASWGICTNYFYNGIKSDTAQVATGDTLYLTSNTFSTVGNTYVLLKFEQICKVDFFDAGTIEVSNDGGATWTQLTGAEYQGTAPFGSQSNKFQAASYSTWVPGTPTAIPNNSTWWKAESFDVSALLSNTANAKIRFALADGSSGAPGANGNYGWILDSIKVIAAPCELIAPTITQNPPVYSGVVYNTGPFNINATITDASGIDSAWVVYTINGGPNNVVNMTSLGGNNYQGVIPAVNDSDTICYTIHAMDSSCANNAAQYPAACTQFIAYSGIVFPYVDNFDPGNPMWTDSVGGDTTSKWELGTPSFGFTNSAFSNPNAWDINLTTAYGPNAKDYLMSPIFDFSSTVNATLSFMSNYYVEGVPNSYAYDAFRVDYSVNSGVTWDTLGYVGDPNGTNWYNITNVYSSNGPGWTGNSNGWHESKYYLSALSNQAGGVQFRFVFTSDGSIQHDGVSVDNFKITIPMLHDAGVISYIQPSNTSIAGTTDSVKVWVRNFGLDTITTMNMGYSINAGTPVTGVFTGTLNPGDSAIYIFATPFTVPTSNYNICAWTALIGDSANYNDTLCKNPFGFGYDTLNYADNFDIDTNFYAPPMPGTEWELGTPNYGVTNSAYSAPNSWDVNLNTPYGLNADCKLISPYFNFTGISNVKLEFMQNRNIETNYDGFRLDYSLDTGQTWTTLGFMNDPNATNWYTDNSIISTNKPAWTGNSNGWVKSTYDLPAIFDNQPAVQFKFTFNSYQYYQLDGASVDNFRLLYPHPIDIGVSQIISPAVTGIANSSQTVKVKVKNFGTDTVNAFNVAYQLDANPVVSQPWTGTLLPGDSTNIIFTTPINPSPSGSYDLCAWTDLASDQFHMNDTTCINGYNFGYDTLSYSDNFDTDTLWHGVTNSPATEWELGTPNYGTTNSAYSAPNSWDINLTTAYQPNADCYLYSPFFDFSNANMARLNFMQNRNTQTNYDGFRLEYSTDTGQTWNILGTLNDPNGINWYTNASLYSSSEAGWDGNSIGWIESKYHNLSMLNGDSCVQFRFVFTSSQYYTGNGVSVDNFMIINPYSQDLKMDSILSPESGCFLTNVEPVTVRIINWGNDTAMAPIYASYQVGANPVVTDTITQNILPGDTLDYTFINDSANLSNFQTYGITAWVNLPGDMDVSNDTASDSVKNYVGCRAVVKLTTGYTTTTGTNYWELFDNTTNQVIKYVDFSGTAPNTVYVDTLCLPNDNITFNIVAYAYNTAWEVDGFDTTYLTGTSNGSVTFVQDCPPKLSAQAIQVNLVGMNIPIPNNYNIQLKFDNDGLYNLTSLRTTLLVDGTPLDLDTLHFIFGTGLPPGIPQYHIFSNKWNATPGCHTIEIYTSYPNDTTDDKPLNDTTYLHICILDSTSNTFSGSFCDDFESGQTHFYSYDYINIQTLDSVNSSWQIGMPTKDTINTVHSGSNAWVTNLDSNYNDLEKSALYTPVFSVDSGDCYRLSFYNNYNFPLNAQDGGVVEYSIDSGASWHTFGNVGDTTNWYDAAFISGLNNGGVNTPGFGGSTHGQWEYSSRRIRFMLQGQVIFRFRIGSDGSQTEDGWAIDNVCFKNIGKCNLPTETEGINEIQLAGLDLGQNIPNPAGNSTYIPYWLPSSGSVSFSVVNMLGQKMYAENDVEKTAGKHIVKLNTKDWNEGIYFYTLKYNSYTFTKKMVIIK